MSEQLITDSSFVSLSSGFGMIGVDRTTDSFVKKPVNGWAKQRQYDFLIEVNNFAANLVEMLPVSMGQKPAVFTCDDEVLVKEVSTKIKQLTPYFVEATRIARHCGGSGLFLGNGDSRTDKPLNSKNPIIFYNVLEGGSNGVLQIEKIDENPLSPNYNKPLLYKILNSRSDNQFIHHSRIIKFDGVKLLTREQKDRYNYWGASVLQRSFEHLKNLSIADQSVASTISQFSRMIYEIDGLTTLLSTDQGRKVLKERLELSNFSWSVLKTMVINKDEKVSNLKVDYTGVDTVLAHMKEMLAGSCDIPYQKLFNSGSGGTGLGNGQASSHSQNNMSERQWSEYVNSRQNSDWLEPMVYILKLLFPVLETIPFTLEFPSILQLTEQEVSALKKEEAETEKIRKETEQIGKQSPDNVIPVTDKPADGNLSTNT